MSNPFFDKMKSTGATKMAHTSGSAKNYESQQDKAKDRYGPKASKFADGGVVGTPSNPTPPSTDARDMMQDRSNAKIGDFRNRVRLGRYLGSQ